MRPAMSSEFSRWTVESPAPAGVASGGPFTLIWWYANPTSHPIRAFDSGTSASANENPPCE